jgi:cyclopropane fatty-acyl-phospholipid synthase-like methyltransferase
MDRALVSSIAHRWHPIAAPVSPSNARTLLRRLGCPPDGDVVDLGCGQGEWLLGLLDERSGVRGTGVDISEPALAEAQTNAGRRGAGGRVTWVRADAATWSGGGYDAVICVGASHVFGGLTATLAALRAHLRPGGRVLFGDAFWETPPSPAAQRALEAGPDDYPDLAGFLERVADHDYEVGYGHISTLEEWDDYEWSWTGSLTEWALAENTREADRLYALEVARSHRSGWLVGYRRQLGFLTVVLRT